MDKNYYEEHAACRKQIQQLQEELSKQQHPTVKRVIYSPKEGVDIILCITEVYWTPEGLVIRVS